MQLCPRPSHLHWCRTKCVDRLVGCPLYPRGAKGCVFAFSPRRRTKHMLSVQLSVRSLVPLASVPPPKITTAYLRVMCFLLLASLSMGSLCSLTTGCFCFVFLFYFNWRNDTTYRLLMFVFIIFLL